MRQGIGRLATALGILMLAGCSHEAADWKSATAANTTEAYQQFLQQHPSSTEATEARTRMQQLAEDRDWQSAAATDTRDAYEQFIAQHADSKWAQEARIRIENFSQSQQEGGSAPLAAGSSAPAPLEQPAPGVAAPSVATPPPPAAPPAAAPVVKSTPKVAKAKVTPAKSAAKVVTAKASSKSEHGASAGGHLVQLGAFHTKERAQTEWKQLVARYPSQLKTLTPRFVAGHSKGGTVYRLQVRVATANGAKGLCSSLKRHSQVCVPVTA